MRTRKARSERARGILRALFCRQRINSACAAAARSLEESWGLGSSHAALPCVEPLEDRTHLTTFIGDIIGSPTFSSSYSVTLKCTGGEISTVKVHWGDGSTNTYSGPGPLTESHNYGSTHPSNPITADFFATNGQCCTTALGLDSNFNNDNGYSATSSLGGGKAMTVDNASGSSFNGYIYVASTDGSQIGITRFFGSNAPSGDTPGTVDSSFGTSGTFLLTSLDPGHGTDVPTSIAVGAGGDRNTYIGVCGYNTQNGWGVAVIEADGSNPGGASVFQNNGTTLGNGLNTAFSQANSITVDGTDVSTGDQAGVVIVAGTVQGTSLSCMAIIQLDMITGGPYDSNFNSGNPVLITSSHTNGCTFGTSIMEIFSSDCVVAVGRDLYTANGHTEQDFTVVELNDNGSAASGFGTSGVVETNFGKNVSGATNNPSMDYASAVVEYNGYITAVGYSNAKGANQFANQFAIAQYSESTGALNTGFNSTGLLLGPTGTATSAVVETVGTNSDLLVCGNVNSDVQLVRYTTNGAADTLFGTGTSHTIQSDFGTEGTSGTNSTDVAYSIGLLSDGSIIVGGSTTPSGGSAEILLANYDCENRPT